MQEDDANPEDERGRDKSAPGKGSRDEREPRRGQEKPQPGEQPGGGRHSESEKPSSPDSRWGGGRNP